MLIENLNFFSKFCSNLGYVEHIAEDHQYYDALAYTLLFPFGSAGFQPKIPKHKIRKKQNPRKNLNPDEHDAQKLYEYTRGYVTPREFAAYNFMVRPNQSNYVIFI